MDIFLWLKNKANKHLSPGEVICIDIPLLVALIMDQQRKPHSGGLHFLHANQQSEVPYFCQEMNERSLPSVENHFYRYKWIHLNIYEYWEYLIFPDTMNNTQYRRNLILLVCIFLHANQQSEVPSFCQEMNEKSLPSVENHFYRYKWRHLNIYECWEYLFFPDTMNKTQYRRNLILLVCIS